MRIGRALMRILRPATYAEWGVALRAGRQATHPDDEHGRAAADWLLRSQDGSGGYSIGYSLVTGWHVPFPETTGYIIPTMLRAAKRYKENTYERSAVNAGAWLLRQQRKDGSFAFIDGTRKVFDTGQILFGLLAMHHHTKGRRYLDAAVRAGDWIVEQQEDDGSWVKRTYQGIARTYYVRVSWALLRLWDASGEDRFREAAEHQLSWVCRQQDETGWLRHMSFFPNGKPVLHTIAYTVRGLWECGSILGNEKYTDAATKAADALLSRHQKDGRLVAFYREGWRPASRQACPTGLAQVAIVLGRMGKKEAEQLKQELKTYQDISTPRMELRGGLPGTVPVYGSYMRANYPGWAAKFLLDAMME